MGKGCIIKLTIWNYSKLLLQILICSFVLIQKNQKIKAVDSSAKKCSCSTQIVQTHQLPAAGWLRQGRFVRRPLHFFTPHYPRPFAIADIITLDN